jgi:hypothetical protein
MDCNGGSRFWPDGNISKTCFLELELDNCWVLALHIFSLFQNAMVQGQRCVVFLAQT